MSKYYTRGQMRTAFGYANTVRRVLNRHTTAQSTIARAYRAYAARRGVTDSRGQRTFNRQVRQHGERQRIISQARKRSVARRARGVAVGQPAFQRGRPSHIAKRYPSNGKVKRRVFRPKWAMKEWQDMLGKRFLYREVNTQSMNKIATGGQWAQTIFGYSVFRTSDMDTMYTRAGLTDSAAATNPSFPVFNSKQHRHWRYLNIGNNACMVELFVGRIKQDFTSAETSGFTGLSPTDLVIGYGEQTAPTGTTEQLITDRGANPFGLSYVTDRMTIKKISRRLLQPGEHGNFNMNSPQGMFHKGQFKCQDSHAIDLHIGMKKGWVFLFFRVSGWMVHDHGTITLPMENADTKPAYGGYALDVLSTTDTEVWIPTNISPTVPSTKAQGYTGVYNTYGAGNEYVQLPNNPNPDAAFAI